MVNGMSDWNEGFSDEDFEPKERKKVRGVVHREERRAWLLTGIGIWLKWFLYGLPASVAAYTAFLQIQKLFL